MELKDIKRIWLTDTAICIETKEGVHAEELLAQYPRLANATRAELETFTTSDLGIHWEELDEDLSFDGFFKPKPTFSSLGRTLKQIDGINISGIARASGVSQPLLANYISGKKTPSEKRKKEIEAALHRLGKELLAVKL